ncbi:retrovirus-related Pol polyprotein from transposon 297 [Trichonephila clavipes]|uniref:Retrovirus-related Pol polyprotein from transposon 297 n=1 Tax=Trichonephila clavipes TaxID=2585209 RepID=A0A8X6SB30_TRICX|nr:retrovirus-related Pol polyprotein from transposon 297 [Trichonephila clavipes]
MSPVELPYVPILLDETFTKALWDTGAEKSFISEETYRKYFFCGSKIILDFDRKSLAIPNSQIDKVVKTVEVEKVEIDLSKTKLEEKQKRELQDLFDSFQGLFSDKPGLMHVLYHEIIDTGDNPPVVSRPYRYDRVKQEILDYHVDKMLKEGTIIPIQSPYALPVVLCRKKNGLPPDNPEAYRFADNNRKLNAITKYPRYPLPLIDDLIMNIAHTAIMSALDLRSGYFQMAVNPSDIVKTAFVTKNGTYAFRRMPFGLSGAAPNFQKAIDIILKPVIGKFVNVYMDDVIISSPSFTQHAEHLKEVFRLLHEAGERLGIRHVKTVVHRPQANRIERVNRDLVQMIANYVNEQHDTWDQFLSEFAYAVRTAVNETTGKTPAELFLGRKLITPFQKLVMVSDGTEFVVGDIERLFEEARRNTKTKH